MANAITADERKEILEREVTREVKHGWQVVSQTDSTAQLVRRTAPNLIVAVLLLCLIILPGVLYLIFYRGQQSLYIQVDHFGHVQRTRR